MSDNLPTVWSAEEHTLAKHRILQEYLAAWMPILSNQSQKLGTQSSAKYIDGFAGPGVYENGEKGSPVLALDVALNHSQAFPVPIEFTFVEDDQARHATLSQQLYPYRSTIANSRRISGIHCIHGDCREVINNMLKDAKSQKRDFGPALVFLDQFGYAGVPMSLVKLIMSERQCEVLTFFFWRELDRFMTDANKHAGVTTAYGGDEWKHAINLQGDSRIQFMSDTYINALRSRAGARYVWPFAMFDTKTRLLAWLFFCTNNIRGLEEMKKAMWKVDGTGGFAFSDRHGLGQLTLLRGYTDDALVKDIELGLVGTKKTVAQVKEWVLTETPAYLFKPALAKVEARGRVRPLNPPPGRRSGQFPSDSMLLEFIPESQVIPTSLF